MATSTSSVISLDEAGAAAAANGFGLGGPPDPDTGRRGRVYIRRDLGIESFGVNAFFQGTTGALVIGEHDELGPAGSNHEELYVVVAGDCTFTVDGDELDAPPGTAVFVRDPAAKRSARAKQERDDRPRRRRPAGRSVPARPDRGDLRVLPAVPRGGLRGRSDDPALGPGDEPGQRLHPLQRRVLGGAARPRGSGARAPGGSARRVAGVQGARRERRGPGAAARRPAIPVARVVAVTARAPGPFA